MVGIVIFIVSVIVFDYDIPFLKSSNDLCGNGVCEIDFDETPLSCFNDCKQQIWDLDSIFCMPLFNCGNWTSQWFILMIGVILIIIMFFNQKPKKNKRRFLF